MMGAGGELYGATVVGPAPYTGSVFSLTRPSSPGGAWTETELYDIPDVGGYLGPVVMGSGGAFYGATWATGGGTVFSLTPPLSTGGDWTETVIGGLKNAASGLAISSGGRLYGTTLLGGASRACFGLSCGTVFAFTPPASSGGSWTKNVLYSFNGGDGAYPVAGVLVGPGNVLYGAASGGGEFGFGALYSLTPPASLEDRGVRRCCTHSPAAVTAALQPGWCLGPAACFMGQPALAETARLAVADAARFLLSGHECAGSQSELGITVRYFNP